MAHTFMDVMAAKLLKPRGCLGACGSWEASGSFFQGRPPLKSVAGLVLSSLYCSPVWVRRAEVEPRKLVVQTQSAIGLPQEGQN